MNRKPNNRDIKLSKLLSFVLRHGAEKLSFYLDNKGFAEVDELLKNKQFENYTLEDIQRVVDTNDKKRFVLELDGGRLKIRACQGHSLKSIDLGLQVLSPGEIELAVHGTYYKFWESIKQTGLKALNRNHIHFSCSDKFVKPGTHQGPAISGFRANAEIIIYLNIEQCLKDGIKLYRSENNVILSEGIGGVIDPKYFLKVIDRKTGQEIN
jgi:2'-phosphotransferase